MSSRRNFLDADNSVIERNLRFVKNDLEDNFNQYFGGSDGRGKNSTTLNAPPRDYKVVQPKPDGSHARTQTHELENRRKFLLKLGLARHEAYELAKNTNFDVYGYERKLLQWLDHGIQRDKINNKILCDIRNENNWNEDIGQRDDKTELNYSAGPLISTCLEDQANLKRERREYKEIYANRSPRNRSRSSSRPYDCQPIRSCSSNIDYINETERKNEEYFSPRANFRDDVRKDTVCKRSRSRTNSPLRCDQRVQRYLSTKSRSPSRSINNEYFVQHDERDEVRRDTDRRRSRSYSPGRNDLTGEHYQLSRSRSPHSGFGEKKYRRENVRRDSVHEQYHTHAYSPPKSDIRQDRFTSSRSRSPNRGFNSMQERNPEKYLKHDNFGNSVKGANYDRIVEEHYKSSRSRSPNRGFKEKNSEQNEHFRDTTSELSRFSAKYHRDQLYRSSRSRSSNEGFSSLNERTNKDLRADIRKDINYFGNSYETSNLKEFKPSPSTGYSQSSHDRSSNHKFSNTKADSNGSKNIQKHETSSVKNRQIPSLLTMSVLPYETTSCKKNSQNCNIPSLLSLQVFPNPKDFEQPSTSASRYNKELSKKIPQEGIRKQTNFQNERMAQQNENMPTLRSQKALIPVIQSGFKKPPPGHLKSNPKDYWSQWWPQYKYIEYSTPKIDPNDIEVKTCIKFMFKPYDYGCRQRRNLLLDKGVRAIMKTFDMNERNYFMRDIYKLFKYKKHLEDPNFQNTLTPQELNRIAPALRQFQIKPTMAFLHQAIICRWHISLDIIKRAQAGEPIKSNYARELLNDKCFHYLTKESIQELKKMCQDDWLQFNEFYKRINAKRVDIYSMGVGPNMTVNNANFVYKHEDESEEDEIFQFYDYNK